MLVRKKLICLVCLRCAGRRVSAGARISPPCRSICGPILLEPLSSRTVRPARIPPAPCTLESARGAYVSVHLVASVPEGGEYRLELKPFAANSGIQADLFREWFHYLARRKALYSGRARAGAKPLRLAAAGTRQPHREADRAGVLVGRVGAGVGARRASIGRPRNTARRRPHHLAADQAARAGGDGSGRGRGRHRSQLLRHVVVLLAVPGAGAAATVRTSLRAMTSIDLLHAYHRIFYEHRGVFHQLGYGHAGKVGPEFAPRLEGSGKTRRIADWTLYDRHYGPLFDGSAFASTRRGAKPIPFVYLPINPEWPASQLWWGEPGYEREFVNVVSGDGAALPREGLDPNALRAVLQPQEALHGLRVGRRRDSLRARLSLLSRVRAPAEARGARGLAGEVRFPHRRELDSWSGSSRNSRASSISGCAAEDVRLVSLRGQDAQEARRHCVDLRRHAAGDAAGSRPWRSRCCGRGSTAWTASCAG